MSVDVVELAGERRCWITVLVPEDVEVVEAWGDIGASQLRLDARPTWLRAGELLFCVHPETARVLAVAEALEEGVTALHDKDVPGVKWLFKVPVRPVFHAANPEVAPRLRDLDVLPQRVSTWALGEESQRVAQRLVELSGSPS